MPRALRLEYPGAIYHVMSRGDRKEPVFQDGGDCHDFLKTLGEACQKTRFEVQAYCLMKNHFHLVVETPEGNLVAGMRWLLSTYSNRFNHRHQLCGHLFSGRYKAQLVEGGGQGHVRTVCDYTHLNPVRAKLLQRENRLLEYPWSSFALYLTEARHQPPWLRVDRLLGEHGIAQDTPAGRREAAQARAETIIVQELRRRQWTEADLAQRPKTDPAKVALAAKLRGETTLTMEQVARRLRMGTRNTLNAKLKEWKRTNESTK